MGGWNLFVYLAVGTVGTLVFLSIVADDAQRLRTEQDARKAALDHKRDQAARRQAAIEDRKAGEQRRAERRKKLLGAAEADTASEQRTDDVPTSEQ